MMIQAHSKWLSLSGRIFEIVGIWATGSEAKYTALAYDLKAEGEPVRTVERDKLIELIETNKLKQI